MGHRISACYDGNKKDGVLARPKIVFETKVQPVQGKSLQNGCNQRGGKHRGCVGMIVIRCTERALRYERMMGRALESRTAR